MKILNIIKIWEYNDTLMIFLIDIILAYIAIQLIKKGKKYRKLVTVKGRQVIFDEYAVTFDYKKNKCSIKRLDGERINTSSEKFIRDFREIRKTEEYERNFKLMNLNYNRKYAPRMQRA